MRWRVEAFIYIVLTACMGLALMVGSIDKSEEHFYHITFYLGVWNWYLKSDQNARYAIGYVLQSVPHIIYYTYNAISSRATPGNKSRNRPPWGNIINEEPTLLLSLNSGQKQAHQTD